MAQPPNASLNPEAGSASTVPAQPGTQARGYVFGTGSHATKVEQLSLAICRAIEEFLCGMLRDGVVKHKELVGLLRRLENAVERTPTKHDVFEAEYAAARVLWEDCLQRLPHKEGSEAGRKASTAIIAEMMKRSLEEPIGSQKEREEMEKARDASVDLMLDLLPPEIERRDAERAQKLEALFEEAKREEEERVAREEEVTTREEEERAAAILANPFSLEMTVTPEIEQPFGLLFVPDDPILVPASVETPPPFAAYVPGVADELPPLVVNAPFHTTGCELSGPRAAAVRDWQARKERERRAWAAPERFPCTLLPPDTDPFQRPHKDLLILTVAEPRPLPAPQIVPAIALDSDEPFRLALTVKRTQCAWALPVAALFVPDDQAIAPVMCDHHVQYNIYGWESEEVQCEELEREVLESGEDVVHLPRVGGWDTQRAPMVIGKRRREDEGEDGPRHKRVKGSCMTRCTVIKL